MGEPAGLARKGLPNVPRTTDMGDERDAERFAVDMKYGLEKLIQEAPELGITEDEIESGKQEFLDRGKKEGLEVLEGDLELLQRVDLENIQDDKEAVLFSLGLVSAYLGLTKDLNEDALDLGKED